MKKIITVILLLALFLVPMQAMAQRESRYKEIWSADSIDIIRGSNFVKVNNYRKGNGIFTADGKVIIPLMYGALYTDSDCPLYYEVFNENGINNHALIDTENRILIPFEYSDYEIISEDWVAAIVLAKTNGEPYDYSSGFFGSGPDKYIIERVDIYYMKNRTMVGSFTRSQFERAETHGDYLLVEDRSDNLQLYDKSFNKVDTSFDYFYQHEFYIDTSNSIQGEICSRITGESIGKSYSDVDALDNTDYYRVTGKRAGSGVIDRYGNIIVELDYDKVDYTAYGNCVTVEQDGLFGLFDLASKKLILPCEYDEILYDTTDGYIFNGYICVVKNGKVGYVNIDNQITCPIQYTKSAVTNIGCVAYAAGFDGFQLIAADGIITKLDNIAEISKYYCSPSGYFLVAKNNDGLWGVIDWHGEIVIDFHAKYDSKFEFIDDEYMIYNGDDDIVCLMKK